MPRARPRRRSRRPRLSEATAALVRWERVCRVATVGTVGVPHLVPVCHVLSGGKVYFGSGNDGRKVANIRDNPRIALAVDVYSEAWSGLRGVLIQGRARVIDGGPAFKRARRLLYTKYPQYAREAALSASDSVIVEVTPTRVFSWGLAR